MPRRACRSAVERLAMAIPVGSVVYVDYGEQPQLVHTRLVVGFVEGSEHVVVTPDHDIFVEQLDHTNTDFVTFYGAVPGGGLPAGVAPGNVYAFAPITPAQLSIFMEQGRMQAEAERRNRGLVDAAGADAAVARIWVIADMVEGRKIGETVVPPAGHPVMGDWGLMDITDSQNSTRPCLIRRILPDDLGEFCDERVRVARAAEAVEGDDRYVGEDVRTLSVQYNINGERSRSFRDSIGEMRQTEFEDFPIVPRTALEYVKAVSGVSESCYAQHLAWVSQARIPDGDRSIHENEVLSRILDMAIRYDCLNISNLASMELVVRRKQLIAEAHSHNPSAPSYEGADYWMGTGYRAGGGIVVPSLTEHVSRKLQADSQIMKERRKIQEAKGAGKKGKPSPAPKGAPKAPPGASGT